VQARCQGPARRVAAAAATGSAQPDGARRPEVSPAPRGCL